METFRSLFGKLLVFVYHCFDRIVIQGHCRCCHGRDKKARSKRACRQDAGPTWALLS